MNDLSAAAWVEGGIGAFDDGVGSLIPDRFDSYARILHPAGVGDPPADVPWSAVAAWAGREMHSLAQGISTRTVVRLRLPHMQVGGRRKRGRVAT